jgi:hypothetical protein
MTERMQVHIFTDRNLTTHLLNGWSIDKLIQGKIKTISGRTFTIKVVIICAFTYAF